MFFIPPFGGCLTFFGRKDGSAEGSYRLAAEPFHELFFVNVARALYTWHSFFCPDFGGALQCHLMNYSGVRANVM